MSNYTHISIHNVDCISIDGPMFFDTCVWLHLHGPYADPNSMETKVYSKLMKNILESGAKISTHILVVSEFLNRYISMRHEIEIKENNAPLKRKQFRRMDVYKEIIRDASDDIFHMLKTCEISSLECAIEDIDKMLDVLPSGDIDFNDMIIVDVCRGNKCRLVTHDADFFGQNIDIVSGNKAYQRVVL